MKQLKYFFLLLIVACSSPKIVYDYDTKEDFTNYKTFNFFSDAGKGLNNFDIKRIESAITKQLINKGLQQDSVPDFYINFTTKQHQLEKRNTVGVGLGGGGGNVGFGISGGIPIGTKRINQQLTIDFVSANTDQLFWQSISRSVYKEKANPIERTKHYLELIKETLKAFPPRNKNE